MTLAWYGLCFYFEFECVLLRILIFQDQLDEPYILFCGVLVLVVGVGL